MARERWVETKCWHENYAHKQIVSCAQVNCLWAQGKKKINIQDFRGSDSLTNSCTWLCLLPALSSCFVSKLGRRTVLCTLYLKTCCYRPFYYVVCLHTNDSNGRCPSWLSDSQRECFQLERDIILSSECRLPRCNLSVCRPSVWDYKPNR